MKKPRKPRLPIRIQIKGLTDSEVDKLQLQIPNFVKEYYKMFGIVRTINRGIRIREKHIINIDIKKRERLRKIENFYSLKIENKRNEIVGLKNRLGKLEKTFMKYVNLLKPNIWIRKPKPSNPNWRGRVYWGVGHHVKSKRIDFHIISEKKCNKLRLNKTQIKKLGLDKFRQYINNHDLGVLDEN